MSSLTELTPSNFVAFLKAAGLSRAYFVFDERAGKIRASHEALEPIARFLGDKNRDFAGHEAIFLEIGSETSALLAAFVHRTVRGQAAGGLRHWDYTSLDALLRDGLRLARGMSRKSALAGLWWGGGKGIIAQDPKAEQTPAYRAQLYREYGQFVTSLRGVYITAEDAGTTPSDMVEVFHTTRFVTCIPASCGGSGNPSAATATGVVCAMEAALDVRQQGTLTGKRIAMQGAGNVAAFMIGDLLERGVASIVASDISEQRLTEVRRRFGDERLTLKHASPSDLSIFETPCDIFAPCALGAALNQTTIPRLQTGIVCGAANNQLAQEDDDRLLAERGIVYVPDFVANRMGIVHCANEQYGSLPHDPAIERHFGRDWENCVFVITQKVLKRAETSGMTSSQAANALADEACAVAHPIWGHRGRALINSLLEDGWQRRGV